MDFNKCVLEVTNKGFDFKCDGCKYRLKCLTNPDWLDWPYKRAKIEEAVQAMLKRVFGGTKKSKEKEVGDK